MTGLWPHTHIQTCQVAEAAQQLEGTGGGVPWFEYGMTSIRCALRKQGRLQVKVSVLAIHFFFMLSWVRLLLSYWLCLCAPVCVGVCDYITVRAQAMRGQQPIRFRFFEIAACMLTYLVFVINASVVIWWFAHTPTSLRLHINLYAPTNTCIYINTRTTRTHAQTIIMRINIYNHVSQTRLQQFMSSFYKNKFTILSVRLTCTFKVCAVLVPIVRPAASLLIFMSHVGLVCGYVDSLECIQCSFDPYRMRAAFTVSLLFAQCLNHDFLLIIAFVLRSVQPALPAGMSLDLNTGLSVILVCVWARV